VAGLARLRERFVITTLSNGNVSLLTNMAKRAGLPWDCVISAELFRHYKPDPEAYLGCADLLGVAPGELILVAAHPSDLRAARDAGLRTAYVARPQEYGPNQRPPRMDDGEFDFTATDFVDLAEQLGA
jgi:2-haloacid dehalogenase